MPSMLTKLSFFNSTKILFIPFDLFLLWLDAIAILIFVHFNSLLLKAIPCASFVITTNVFGDLVLLSISGLAVTAVTF